MYIPDGTCVASVQDIFEPGELDVLNHPSVPSVSDMHTNHICFTDVTWYPNTLQTLADNTG
jgi:hypothetical protein